MGQEASRGARVAAVPAAQAHPGGVASAAEQPVEPKADLGASSFPRLLLLDKVASAKVDRGKAARLREALADSAKAVRGSLHRLARVVAASVPGAKAEAWVPGWIPASARNSRRRSRAS